MIRKPKDLTKNAFETASSCRFLGLVVCPTSGCGCGGSFITMLYVLVMKDLPGITVIKIVIIIIFSASVLNPA